MQRVVVVYDIVNNKRRRKVSEALEAYGKRVNRSVFECILKDRKRRDSLENKLQELIDKSVDSIRLYVVCDKCLSKSSVIGDEPMPFDGEAVYFF